MKKILQLVLFVFIVNFLAAQEVSIYDIQHVTGEDDASPYKGETVTTSGIVTAVDEKGHFYLQDGEGEWTGILVYDTSVKPNVGDSLTLTAKVTEYHNLTELKKVADFTITSTGNALPEPLVIETAALSEAHEGVLIKFQNATCTEQPDDHGVWKVDDGSGVAELDDKIYRFDPTIDMKYNITGVGTFSYGTYKLLPRNADDIQIISGEKPVIFINEVMAKASNDAEEEIPAWIELYNPGEEDVDLAGWYLSKGTDEMWQFPAENAAATTIPAKGFLVVYAYDTEQEGFPGLYTGFKLKSEADVVKLYYTDKTEVDVVDFGEQTENTSYGRYPDGSSAWIAMPEPSKGAANIKTIPTLSIRDIQYTTEESGNSPYKGEKVKTSGIVTAVIFNDDGEVSKYFIQDAADVWSGVYVYDKEHQDVKVGYKLSLTAKVDEFFGLTELKNVEKLDTISTDNELYAPLVVTPATLGEEHEGVLVKVEQVRCVEIDAEKGRSFFVADNNPEDTLVVNDLIFKVTPELKKKYTVTGIGHPAGKKMQINPRNEEDLKVVIETGIAEAKEAMKFKVYPNPVIDVLTINSTEEIADLKLMNVCGQLVKEKKQLSNTCTLDLSNCNRGVYVLYLETISGQKIARKIIKK